LSNRYGYDNSNPNRRTGRTTYGNAKRDAVVGSVDDDASVADIVDALPAAAPAMAVELASLRTAANAPDLADACLQGTRAMSWTFAMPTRLIAREVPFVATRR
jgi:hypothetical protein